VDRNTALWTITAFFGATIVFGIIRTATEDESAATSLGAQAAALVVMVAVIILVYRRRS